MASKGKNFSKKENNSDKNQGIINGAGEIVEQEIANTLEQNYMPYAMSVILHVRFLRLTALSRRTGSCFIQCTKWGC